MPPPDQMRHEWRWIQAALLTFVMVVVALAYTFRAPESAPEPEPESDGVCTQERDCGCGFCPPYGEDDDAGSE